MPLLGRDRARRVAALATAKGRADAGRILLDTPALVAEGLARGLVEELFHVEGRGEALAAEASRRGVVVTPASPEILARIAAVEESAGVVAVARPPAESSLDDVMRSTCSVYLDGIADPGNLGAVARSAAAFGATGLAFSSGCADPMAPKSLRASAGALLRLSSCRGVEPGDLARVDSRPRIWRAVAHGGIDPRGLGRAPHTLLWLGNEARGPRPSPLGLEAIDVTLPIALTVESLNVAAAAAVLLAVIAWASDSHYR